MLQLLFGRQNEIISLIALEEMTTTVLVFGNHYATLFPVKEKKSCINKQNIDDRVITGNAQIASALNLYFTDVANKLKSKINSDENYMRYVSLTTSVFHFNQVSDNDVYNILCKIPANKATGLDEIPSEILKIATPFIVKHLTHIINWSLYQGIVPLEWKSARITPVFKGGNTTDPANYRPISVLPVLSIGFRKTSLPSTLQISFKQ